MSQGAPEHTEAYEASLSTDAESVLAVLNRVHAAESPRPIVRKIRAGEEPVPSSTIVLNTTKRAMEKLAWGQWDLLTIAESDLLTGRTARDSRARQALSTFGNDRMLSVLDEFVEKHRRALGVTHQIAARARAVLESYPDREQALTKLRNPAPFARTFAILEKIATEGLGALDSKETNYLRHRAMPEIEAAGTLQPFGNTLRGFVGENAESLDTLAYEHNRPKGPLDRLQHSLDRQRRNPAHRT